MEKKKFEKKKLNRDDHKGVDKAADGVKKSGGALLILGSLAVGVKKYGPKVVKAATKVIKK